MYFERLNIVYETKREFWPAGSHLHSPPNSADEAFLPLPKATLLVDHKLTQNDNLALFD